MQKGSSLLSKCNVAALSPAGCCVWALTAGAPAATTTSAAMAAVPINGRFTHHPSVSEMDCHWGVVVPSPISPGGRISLSGPNRDDGFALTTPRRAIIMPTSKQENFRSAMTGGIETLNGLPANRITG